MANKKHKKLLLAGVLLLIFAAVKLAALYFWNREQNPVHQVASACNVENGCVLPDGSKVIFNGPLATRIPFDIQLENVPKNTEAVYISFSMRDMDMGFNRYDLKRQADGSWRANQVRLPVCSAGRRDYLADIHIGNQTFQTGFTAK
ncbi:MAG: hypothetical protein Q4A84_07795 [Neisseria sp.]|uniref:hypothetical protein n=1 Tax=Neisseria sp. TaxID=192066 RepID=UPI0026DC6EC3|nr:hypothetical protein [Neisseria sp.]MDO4641584.1 hypothetical protein [Neisseria sp.]